MRKRESKWINQIKHQKENRHEKANIYGNNIRYGDSGVRSRHSEFLQPVDSVDFATGSFNPV
jgi:hypothetical protein